MLNLAARLISQRTAELLAPLGVAPAYLPVLFALNDLGQCTQNELADRASIVPPTMARTLQRMERDGLIERTVDAADRRRSIVKISKQAEALIPEIEKIALEMNEFAVSGLPQGSETALLDILTQIVDNLRKLDVPHPESSASSLVADPA
ncbi:MarR family winged helix-turn-helix transcriptional regulator [Arthrobacter sp. SD76]|uniref:MarR family winged helix-turn-helix transcriptional regulator n=1 Tax=Arthrobacter sp. SD76 TaxID=3415007 RepID=UPI003C7943ED